MQLVAIDLVEDSHNSKDYPEITIMKDSFSNGSSHLMLNMLSLICECCII